MVAASSGPTMASGSGASGPSATTTTVNDSSSGMLNFLDRVTPDQGAAIDAAILRFFVACRISIRSVESATFISLLKLLRPAFMYNRDLLRACVRNRPALRNLLERNGWTELRLLVKPRDQIARDAQAICLCVAESASDARDWTAACRILDPVAVYLRVFDGQSARLSLMLPATLRLQDEMNSLEETLRTSGLATTASSTVFFQIRAAVDKRVSGPVGRSVRVPLLSDMHYLAASLDPRVFDPQATDVATG
ncbi:hypothetical protein I4F81_005436 [Pyropia yezoensis]|uniref:Uncharacterized protein n=1 Tax=Pyropia yezoensis TaxID=2788 RepID=A0ACC3BYU5_PYRYE|nr:hypothetical protein I4F81_005436 [Neopyropia yezoensis]